MLEVGDLLDDRYEILAIIGEGGFGLVYQAKQESTGQMVAIKLLNRDKLQEDSVQVARFEREMKLIGRLKHPNIVRLIDKGHLDDGALFTVLEFVAGQTLADYLTEQGPLKPRDAARLMEQVLEALSCAHALGIVHRDLKPQNIMVNTSGARPSAMVLDFGIAAMVDEAKGEDYVTLTHTGQFHGTPQFMAPEQLRERVVTPQTDLYAWGLVYTELLSGEPAIKGTSVAEVIYEQMAPGKIALPEHIQRHPIGAIIAKATEKALEDRYQSANDILADMDLCNVGAPMEPVAAPEAPEPGIGTDATMDVDASAVALSTERQGKPAGATTGVSEGQGDGTADTLAGNVPEAEPADARSAGDRSAGRSGGDTGRDTHDVLDIEPPEDWSPSNGGSGSNPVLIIAVVVVLLAAIGGVVWIMSQSESQSMQEDESETTDAADTANVGATAPDLTAAADLEDDTAGTEPEAAVQDADIIARRGVLIPVTGVDDPQLGQTPLSLRKLELSYEFDSNRTHRGVYTIHNGSGSPITAALAIPMRTTCTDNMCQTPSEEQRITMDGMPISGQIVGPMFDMKLYDPNIMPISIDDARGMASGALAEDATALGFDHLFVFEVTVAPGQTASLDHPFTYSGRELDGTLERLTVDLQGLSRWGNLPQDFELELRWRKPNSYCIATNQKASSYNAQKRRLRVQKLPESLDLPIVVEWVRPRPLVEEIVARHGWLQAAHSGVLTFDRDQLSAALRELSGPDVEAIYTELLLAFRAAPNPRVSSLEGRMTCAGRELSYFAANDTMHWCGGTPDDGVTLDELGAGPREAINVIADELERRGVAVTRLRSD